MCRSRGPSGADHLAPILYRCSFGSWSRVLQALLCVRLSDDYEIIPMPRLNVRRQSDSGMSPMRRRDRRNREHWPRSTLEPAAPRPSGKMRGMIVGDASAGDVGGSFEQTCLSIERADWLQIAAMHFQKLFRDGVPRMASSCGRRFRTAACGLANNRWCGGRWRARPRARRRARMDAPVSMRFFSTAPTMKPARSYSPS